MIQDKTLAAEIAFTNSTADGSLLSVNQEVLRHRTFLRGISALEEFDLPV